MEKNFKFFNIDYFYFKKLFILNQNKKLIGKNKIIFRKNNFILKKLVNEVFYVYKGNKFRNLIVTKFHILSRFGHFCFTRKPFKFIQKTKLSVKNLKR